MALEGDARSAASTAVRLTTVIRYLDKIPSEILSNNMAPLLLTGED